jgi:hypothetical protein
MAQPELAAAVVDFTPVGSMRNQGGRDPNWGNGARETGRLLPLNTAKAERAKTVPLALVQHAFKPGQSGNPGGRTASFAECQRLAREASPDAMRRLIELMASPDERVALMAADKILERAWGKPKEQDPDAGGRRYSELPADERRCEVECLIALGKEVIARETGRLASLPQVMEVEAERVHS